MKAAFVGMVVGMVLPAVFAEETQVRREAAELAGNKEASTVASPLPLAGAAEVGLSTERLERIGAWVERLQADQEIAGAVTAVARRGRLVRLEAQGMADLEARRPMQADDIFWIASMTKPIVSVAVLMLLEEQRLSLSDSLEKFVPEYREAKVAVTRTHMREGYDLVPLVRSITLHDLLTHQAGLPTQNGPAGAMLTQRLKELPPEAVLADWVRALAEVPSNTQPGSTWQYGYATDVLGRVVEVASGQSLDEFLRTRLFAPLGMIDTGFTVPPEKHARVAGVYTRGADGKLVKRPPRVPSRIFHGGGGLASTAPDYLRFCQMLLNGGELAGRRVLSRKAVELMTTAHTGPLPPPFGPDFSFGLGVAVRTTLSGGRVLGSPGLYWWGGAASTVFCVDPKEELVLVFMTQRVPARPDLAMEFWNASMQAIDD